MGLTGTEAAWDVRPWDLHRDLRALATGRLCRREQQRRCRAEHGVFADWACQACQEYLRVEEVSPWTWHLVFLHRLKKAGYPFRAGDLSLETWLLLGQVEEALKPPQRGGHGQR